MRCMYIFVITTLLAGCASERVVTRVEVKELPVPVVEKIDPSLTKDCEPKYRYPASSLKIRDIKDRLAATEDALAICRNQLENIRAGQHP